MDRKRRVILKLSGEALAGQARFGFDESKVRQVAAQVLPAVQEGVQLAVVIGGGNFWRGRSSKDMDRSKADQIGMLATVMNCIYVSEVFRSIGLSTRVFTPFVCGAVTELYSLDAALLALQNNEVVFFAGGTGHPYFSTDTATALRAIEISADRILCAKAVDGIYDSDPAKNPDAKKYDVVTYDEVVEKRLAAMDLTATIMCMEHEMPLYVFALNEENSIINACDGEFHGTKVVIK